MSKIEKKKFYIYKQFSTACAMHTSQESILVFFSSHRLKYDFLLGFAIFTTKSLVSVLCFSLSHIFVAIENKMELSYESITFFVHQKRIRLVCLFIGPFFLRFDKTH